MDTPDVEREVIHVHCSCTGDDKDIQTKQRKKSVWSKSSLRVPA